MKPVITLKQYENIFRIVASAAAHFAHGAGRSCLFYNVKAAYILNQNLKIQARPVMGAAFVRLNDSGDTISFAGQEDGSFFSSPDAFHCWVETPKVILDFTAPEYREATPEYVKNNGVPRKMFQKDKRLMCGSPHSLSEPGDYFFQENPELTQHLLSEMLSKPASRDFCKICSDWYKKLSKKGIEKASVVNDLGELTQVKLKRKSLASKW